jgi:hypothetical protein
MVMTPTDNVDSVPDYRVPTGDFIRPATAPMPKPRQFPVTGDIPTGSGAGDVGSTQDSGRRPTSHPALQG